VDALEILVAFLRWSADVAQGATDGLRPWTGVLSFLGGLCGAAGALWGILSKRASTKARTAADGAKASSDETLELVKKLLGMLETRQDVQDRVWSAYLEKDAVASPEKVEKIARRAIEADLLPIHEFFRAVEIVEKHRTHRPETDIIAILEGAAAA
jgi:hypothetical protein